MKTREQITNELIDERGQRYGDPAHGFTTTGMIWRALLEDWYGEKLPGDIPPHIVALMMSGLKLSRAARPNAKPDTDDYDDAAAYLELSQPLNPTITPDASHRHVDASPHGWPKHGSRIGITNTYRCRRFPQCVNVLNSDGSIRVLSADIYCSECNPEPEINNEV